MEKLSIGGKFDWFLDTLSKSGIFVKKLSDTEIETYIFEDFIVGVISFMHTKNLQELKEYGIIDDKIMKMSLDLREKTMKLDNTDLWNVESVKQASVWLEILELSDDIKSLINTKWTKEEIDYLKTVK
ncbi:hypothetical protein [Carnobacterium maltaromaticum]|uniref:hypothetical protein n=1 Tax=Carnobacterium maltaromaticum TaxID=2751 RepID=UPI00165CAF2E|nr:hypothetical protein [Carnobacterium maltaromaticum]MBC9810249.1 hypothetical protein [Carnobacterium maltaromaticum]